MLSLFLLDSVVSPLRAAHRVGTSQSAPGLWQCDARQREEENNKIKSNNKNKNNNTERRIVPRAAAQRGYKRTGLVVLFPPQTRSLI